MNIYDKTRCSGILGPGASAENEFKTKPNFIPLNY